MSQVFNKKKHSDITVVVSGEGEEDSSTPFYLHKFPLISKSTWFDEAIPEIPPGPGPLEIRIQDFPGGAASFETIAKYCYGISIELTVDNIAYLYCAARFLRVEDLEKSTDAFMSQVVLRDPVKAIHVLQAATSINHMSDDMMEGLVGHSINAIAAQFTPMPQLSALPEDAFSCIVRTAKDMDVDKPVLEAAVAAYVEAKLSTAARDASGKGAMPVEDFVEVVSAPGRVEDMRHSETLFGLLEVMLAAHPSDEAAERLCKALHELGFWVCLPHVVIERAYADRNIPDRYVTVALMAENRHLLKVNEQLAEQVEQLTDALRSETALGGAGGMAGALPPAHLGSTSMGSTYASAVPPVSAPRPH